MKKPQAEEAAGHTEETMNMQDLIPLKDYAEKNNIDVSTLRHRIRNGTLPEAVKMANAWFVPRDLPLVDNRTKGRTRRWNKTEE